MGLAITPVPSLKYTGELLPSRLDIGTIVYTCDSYTYSMGVGSVGGAAMLRDGNTNGDRIRIGIVDANTLYRESLAIALTNQHDLELAFATSSPDDVPSAAGTDVLIFSTAFPNEAFGEGLALDYWHTRCPTSRIVLVTLCRARKTIQAVVAAGVDGYAIRNTVGIDALRRIIHHACHNPPALCDEALRILQQPPRENDLTFRELQTIQLLHALGLTNRKRAAQQLDMSDKTLNVHLRNACQKLQVSGAAEAIRQCLEMGLIE